MKTGWTLTCVQEDLNVFSTYLRAYKKYYSLNCQTKQIEIFSYIHIFFKIYLFQLFEYPLTQDFAVLLFGFCLVTQR